MKIIFAIFGHLGTKIASRCQLRPNLDPSWAELGPTWPHLGPPDPPKTLFFMWFFNGFDISPICVLRRPRQPQDGPKTAPRAPGRASRGPKRAPRGSKRRPMDAQEDPRAAQGGPKTPPRRPQDGPKRLPGHPRFPQDAPGPPQTPQTPQNPPGPPPPGPPKRQISSRNRAAHDPTKPPINFTAYLPQARWRNRAAAQLDSLIAAH